MAHPSFNSTHLQLTVMPPTPEENQQAWDSNPYVRITIHVVIIICAMLLIKPLVSFLYMWYMRKRHPEQSGL